MMSQKDDLVLHIGDLDCQIECLERALKLDMAKEQDEFRLNSLIVKRAQYRKTLENIETESNTSLLLKRLNMFSRQPKQICDYFRQ